MAELVASTGMILEQASPPNGDVEVKRRVSGFIDYNDTGTAATPITLAANTWTTITNNGAGAFSNSTYPPSDSAASPAPVDELMDVTTGQFDFSELALGAGVFIRNDFSVTPSTDKALLTLRYQIGTGAGAYVQQKSMGRLDDGSGKAYPFQLLTDFIYMGDVNTRDNPITIQLHLTTDGTVVSAGSVIWAAQR